MDVVMNVLVLQQLLCKSRCIFFFAVMTRALFSCYSAAKRLLQPNQTIEMVVMVGPANRKEK